MNPLAWSKSVELSNGVVVTYWVLLSMKVNMLTAQASVDYKGYIDEAAFLAGKDPVIGCSSTIDFSSFDPEGNLAAGVVAMVQAAQ